MRKQLLRKHADELAAGVKRAEDLQKKKLENEHNQSKRQALADMTNTLKGEHRQQLKTTADAAKRRHHADMEMSVSREKDLLQKKLEQEFKRDKAQLAERLKREALGDKTKAVDACRTKMQSQHGTDTRTLKKEVSSLTEEVATLRRDRASTVEKMQASFKKEKAEALEGLRSRLTKQSTANVGDVRMQNTKLAEEVDKLKQDKAAAVAKLKNEFRAEKTTALKEVEERAQKQSSRKIAELEAQNTTLAEDLSKIRQEKAAVAERLTADFRVEKTREIEALRDRLQAHYEKQTAAIKNELATATSEVSAARQDKTSASKQMADFRVEKTRESEALRQRLSSSHDAQMASLKKELATVSGDLAAARLAKTSEVEKLTTQLRKDKTKELEALRSRLNAQYGEQIAFLKNERSSSVNDLEATRKVQASVTDRLTFDFKQEKAEDLEALRVRLEAQHKEQAKVLKDQIRKLNEVVSGHEDKARTDSSESQRREVNKKLSLQSLRKIVSNLLKDMKLALKPPVNAPLDTSEASPSVAMGKLQTLAKALSLKTPDFTALHAASAEAHVAPPVAFDILQECVIELVDDLNQANKEIIALHMESMRDTKILRKQVEDDVTGKYMRQLLEQRHKVTQQVDAATTKLERELDAKHKLELREQQELLEREIRATRQDVLARTFKDQHKADVLAQTTAADMEEERLREIGALGKELDHVRAELDDCLQELEDRKIETNEMRRGTSVRCCELHCGHACTHPVL